MHALVSAVIGFLLLLSVLAFGAAVAWALGIRSRVGVAGFACSFGIAAYLTAINALGHIMPIGTAFWLAAAFCLLAAGLIFFLTRHSGVGDADAPPRRVIWTVVVLAVLGGLVNARFLGSDPWTWGQLPVIASILEGNFPLRQLTNPSYLLGYHYGPQLLAAAAAYVTQAPIAIAYDLQAFPCVAGGLLCVLALARRMGASWNAALCAAVLAFGATGVMWVNGLPLAWDLFRHYALGQSLDVPFRWLAPMVSSTLGPSMLIIFGSRTFMFGFPFLYGFLLSLHCLFAERRLRYVAGWIAVGIVFGLAIALTVETTLVLLFPAAALFVAVLLLRPRAERTDWLRTALLLAAVLVPSLFLAFIQGGVLSVAGTQEALSPSSFAFGFDGYVRFNATGEKTALWQWKFIREMGLPFFLFPVAAAYWWRHRRKDPFALFIAAVALGHFLVPFVVRYLPRAHELLRTNYVALTLSAFLIGIMLGETWLKAAGWKKIVAWLALAAMLLSSAVYIVVRLTIPNMRFESAPFFAPMPPATPEQHAMYAWVKENTSQSDYFYLSTLDEKQVDEIRALQPDRILFMTYTGRFSVGYLLWGMVTAEQMEWQRRIEASCDAGAFRKLHVRYLVVETAERDAWFRKECDASDWSVVYQTPDAAYPRIEEFTRFEPDPAGPARRP